MSHGKPRPIVCHARRENPRCRLVCLPHGGGGAHAYASWPQDLPDWIEVVAYQPPGRGARSREPVVSDMDSLAADLLSHLTPYLDLPVILFGHSVGALVAFEAARRLERMGVRPLAVIVSAHAEPDVATRAATLGNASDDGLMASIAELGLLPPDALSVPGFRELVLPPTRADFQISEGYRPDASARIECPLFAFGGSDDPIVDSYELGAWRTRSSGAFEVQVFPGGHFYTQSDRPAVLAAVAAIAARALDALPLSVMIGAREDYPLDVCLHELFRREAARSPAATALVGVDRTLDFATLDRESDLLARALVARGCGVDCMVAILMETSVDYVVAYLAILKAGGAYLPIPLATPDAAIARILESVTPVAVVTRGAECQRLPDQWQTAARCIALDDGWQASLAAAPAPSPCADREQPGPLSLAYCVMTSGTTGNPKGIVCPHRGAVNSYWWRFVHLPYGDDEREACNVFFVWEVLRPLLQGRPAHVIPDGVIFDPRRLIDFLERHEITRVLFTPSLFETVLAHGDNLVERLKRLRMVILNGEVVSHALAARARSLLPHVALVNDYSISECHDVSTSRIGDATPSPGSRTLPAGRVMANVRVYILDESLKPVPYGVPGEVYVSGPTLARGYLNLPEETASRFLPDLIAGDGGRMFRTGDIGRFLSDGQLEIKGRARFMIKLRGYSVVPSAVEAVISAHPAVGGALVTTIDDPETGQPDSLVAYVAGHARAPSAGELAALLAHLKRHLPAYSIPAHIVPLAALPIQATTGKVDRKRLPPVEPSPAPSRVMQPVAADGIEAAMRELWTRVLGRPPASSDDNFFDLGGHSLLAIELAREAERLFGVRLDVVDVFNHATLSAFSRHVAGCSVNEPARATRSARVPIAVIGMACRFPGAANPEALWDKLVRGVECLRTFTPAELAARGVPQHVIDDPSYVRTGATLDGVDLFDARFFGLSDREAVLMDPQQRLFIECCHEALERAGHAADAGRLMTGVWAGCYLPGYLVHHLGARRHLDPADPTTFHLAETGNDKDYLASRAAFLLGLEGPAIGVQTSCSTGLVAIAEAAAALHAGRCDMALAGASSISFPQGGYLHVDGHIASRAGHCRTFDAAADGTILGDGIGVVVLRRLDDALAGGDDILAVIEGYAVNNDGASKAGYSAPSGRGQARAISAALEMAGVDPAGIGYIEAHGTATVVGDPIEVRALAETYGRRAATGASCVLGSVKANLGHSNIAAGVAGFIKTVLTLHHRRFAPQINFSTPNPELRLSETPFFIDTAGGPWTPPSNAQRRAAVSSFGIGGTNAHMVLVEAPPPQPVQGQAARSHIFPVSAKTSAALAAMSEQLAGHLSQTPKSDLAAVSATLQLGRRDFPLRRAVVATTAAEAAAALAAPARLNASPRGEGIVLVFPGQGSEHPAMAAGLLRDCPQFSRHFDEVAACFAEHGLDLGRLRDSVAAPELMAAAPGRQASLFATEWALAQTLLELGVRPRALAGHSLGQIVAAAVGGALTLADAASLVAARARAMEDAQPGAMLAVAAASDDVRALLSRHPDVQVAALNAPRETVVAGPLAAIAAFERDATAAGMAVRRLAVARAFHSPMMSEAAVSLAVQAATMRMSPPRIPVACNISGGWLSEADIRDPAAYWSRAILAPVAFAANIGALLALDPAAVVEVGPGRTLTRLLNAAVRTNGAATVLLPAMPHARDVTASATEALDRCIAGLWETGAEIDWRRYREGQPVRRIALPTYPFERRRYWPKHDVALAPDDAGPPTGHKLPWQQRFYVPSLRRASPPGDDTAPPPRQHWLLLAGVSGDSAEPARALTQALSALGHEVEVSNAAPAAAIERLATCEGEPRLVCMWPCITPPGEDTAQSHAGPVVELTSLLANRQSTRPLQVYVLSRGAMGGAHPAAATVLGPLLSLGQEDPTITARLVDIGSSDWTEVVHDIALEITAATPRPEPQIALSNAGRWVERYDQVTLGERQRTAGRVRLARGPHLITGGLGRIGLVLAKDLIARGAEVILVSRRTLPPRDQWAALSGMEPLLQSLLAADAGTGRLSLVTADVSDRDAMRTLLEETSRHHGRLGGIFHAAGLARLTSLAEATAETLADELAPKERGTLALEAAISDRAKPSFVMLFSSLAATLGGLGLGAYAAANRYLDAFVDAAPVRRGVPWISVAWDDWDFDYGAAQQAAYAHTREGLAISPLEGVAAIEAILGEPHLHRVLVSATPLQPRLARWVARHSLADPAPAAPQSHEAVAVASTLTDSERLVRSAYTKILGATASGLDDDFFDLGGDSLLATEIVLDLSRSSGRHARKLRVTDVFDHPTIRSLATHMESAAAPLQDVAE